MKDNFLKYLLLLNVFVGLACSTSTANARYNHALSRIKNLQAYQEVIDYIEQVKQMGLDEAELNEVLEEFAKPISAKNNSTNDDRNKKIIACVIAAAALGVTAWLLYKWMQPEVAPIPAPLQPVARVNAVDCIGAAVTGVNLAPQQTNNFVVPQVPVAQQNLFPARVPVDPEAVAMVEQALADANRRNNQNVPQITHLEMHSANGQNVPADQLQRAEEIFRQEFLVTGCVMRANAAVQQQFDHRILLCWFILLMAVEIFSLGTGMISVTKVINTCIVGGFLI